MVIWIMGVYGPPGIRGRDQFLTEMGDLFGLCGPIWCVAGDFNMAWSQVKQELQGRRTRSSRKFNDFIEGGDWFDPSFLNGRFTWANSRTKSRTDRVLLLVNWINLFGEVSRCWVLESLRTTSLSFSPLETKNEDQLLSASKICGFVKLGGDDQAIFFLSIAEIAFQSSRRCDLEVKVVFLQLILTTSSTFLM